MMTKRTILLLISLAVSSNAWFIVPPVAHRPGERIFWKRLKLRCLGLSCVVHYFSNNNNYLLIQNHYSYSTLLYSC
jgi:hypothetical protein